MRKKLFYEIISKYKFSLTWSHSWEIDSLGLRVATDKAILQSCSMFEGVEKVILDGRYIPKSEHNITSLIKGDQNNLMISYASIIAKEMRDNYMHNLDKLHQKYAWNSNVGYGTKIHREAIEIYGITKFHRKSYKPLQMFNIV